MASLSLDNGSRSFPEIAIQLLITTFALVTLYSVSRIIYNLYLHPLAKFPGPRIAAISNLWYCIHSTAGRWPDDLEQLHEKYGPVVRYSPNEVDFATPASYQDIHGPVKAGKQLWIKGEQYNTGPESDSSIVQARDPNKHKEVRRMLSPGFSARSLRAQEEVVHQYVDMFIDQIKKRCTTESGLNMHYWFMWLTFDIIGDLAFGESFGAVESGEGHPWVALVPDSIHLGALFDVIKRMPILTPLVPFFLPKDIEAKRKVHFENALQKAKRRMEKVSDRDDFFSGLLRDRQNGPEITTHFIVGQAETLVVAGSETTATFLAGVTYYLLKSPEALNRLTSEIRSTFSEANLINGDSTQSLPYLSATIEEGLRIYPPVPTGLPRVSPGAVIDGHYIPAGCIATCSNWVNTHTEKNFKNAKSFHPERWLPSGHAFYDEAYNNDVKEAHRPFNIGPRACLGINLAYMEMRIILARMVWEFDWELKSKGLNWETENKLQVIMWEKPDIYVKYTPVKRP